MKYSAPTSLSPKASPMDNFVTIISLHEGSDGAKYIRDYLKENAWTGKVIFVSNVDNQHYNQDYQNRYQHHNADYHQ